MIEPNFQTNKLDYYGQEFVDESIADLLLPLMKIVSIDGYSKPQVDLVVTSENTERIIRMPLEVLSAKETTASSLLNCDYLISHRYINPLRDYLTERIQALDSSTTHYTYKSLGYYPYNGKELFLLGDTTTPKGELLHYYDDNYAFVRGNAEEYDKLLKNQILKYPAMRLALVIGLAAPIASKLTHFADTQTIIINVCGPSSTGKTTMAQFISSLWGSPVVSNRGITRTFNATDNSIITATEGVSGVSIVLDDATAGGYHNFTNLVYTLAQGEPKGRLGSDGKPVKQGRSWSGVVIITSETPILSESENRQGLIARVIDTNNITWTKSAAHATEIKRMITANHGFIGRRFVDHLMNDNELKLESEYLKMTLEVDGMIEYKDNLTQRIISKIAIFRLTANLIKKYLGYSELDVDEMTKLLISFDQADVKERHIGEKAINAIKLFITTNYSKFLLYEANNTLIEGKNKASIQGKIVFKKDELIVSIPQDIVNSVLRDKKIFEIKPVMAYWKDNGYIITNEKDRKTVKDYTLNVRVVRFRFNMSKDALIPMPAKRSNYRAIDGIPPTSDIKYDDEEAINEIFDEQANSKAVSEGDDDSETRN